MPTSKTSNLTADQALQILQEAVNRCQKAGVPAAVSNFFNNGTRCVVIILEEVVKTDDGNLVPTDSEK